MVEEKKVSLRSGAGVRALLARLAPLPAGYDKVHFDGELPGYGLRVRASGVHSLMVQYAVARNKRRIVIGKLSGLDPGKAYANGKTLLARVRLGHDPAMEKDHARIKAKETFGALLPLFLRRQKIKQKPRSYQETERHLMKHCKVFHRRPVEWITRRIISERLTEIEEQSGPAASNRVRASLSAYFTWLAREGCLDSNPVAFTNKAIENGARERVLLDPEVRAIWSALGDDSPGILGELSEHYAVILRLLLLTGARRDEIGGLRRTEVDFDKARISLPPERTKNKREHLIPLSRPVMQILAAQPLRANPDGSPRDHFFGTGFERGFQGWSKCKRALDTRIAQADSGKGFAWTPHDFRRTLSTNLHERFKVMPHVVETILGHISGHKAGVAGTYNKALYLDERRDALERWAGWLMQEVSDKSLRRVAGGRRR